PQPVNAIPNVGQLLKHGRQLCVTNLVRLRPAGVLVQHEHRQAVANFFTKLPNLRQYLVSDQTLSGFRPLVAHRLPLSLTLRVAWYCPIRKTWRVRGPVVLVEVNPRFVEIVQVAAQSKAGTCAFECLRLRTRCCVLVVGPFLADTGVRPESVDRDL